MRYMTIHHLLIPISDACLFTYTEIWLKEKSHRKKNYFKAGKCLSKHRWQVFSCYPSEEAKMCGVRTEFHSPHSSPTLG